MPAHDRSEGRRPGLASKRPADRQPGTRTPAGQSADESESEVEIWIPQGSAGCVGAVTNTGRLHRVVVRVRVRGGADEEEVATFVGAGEASAPMKAAALGGAPLALFGPWERGVWLVVRCEASDTGGRTWRGTAVRNTTSPTGESGIGESEDNGSRIVTIRSDGGSCHHSQGRASDSESYNDAITTVCFAPQAFCSPPSAGQQPVFVPIGFSASLSCVADSRERERFSVADARGSTLAVFDDDGRGGGGGGGGKRPMSHRGDGQRTTVLGPWDRHAWLVTSCSWAPAPHNSNPRPNSHAQGDLSGWNPSRCTNLNIRMNGSKILYTITGRDGGDGNVDNVVATLILAAV